MNKVSRRDFLKGSGVVLGGLFLGTLVLRQVEAVLPPEPEPAVETKGTGAGIHDMKFTADVFDFSDQITSLSLRMGHPLGLPYQSTIIEVEGYHIQRFKLNAHWFGGDQRRKRKFHFGSKRKVNIRFLMPPFESPIEEAPVLATEIEKGFRPSYRSEKYKPSRSWERICQLQGLPPDFELPPFTKAEAGRAVGNGVPVHLAQAWAKAIKGAFYGEL